MNMAWFFLSADEAIILPGLFLLTEYKEYKEYKVYKEYKEYKEAY